MKEKPGGEIKIKLFEFLKLLFKFNSNSINADGGDRIASTRNWMGTTIANPVVWWSLVDVGREETDGRVDIVKFVKPAETVFGSSTKNLRLIRAEDGIDALRKIRRIFELIIS